MEKDHRHIDYQLFSIFISLTVNITGKQRFQSNLETLLLADKYKLILERHILKKYLALAFENESELTDRQTDRRACTPHASTPA